MAPDNIDALDRSAPEQANFSSIAKEAQVVLKADTLSILRNPDDGNVAILNHPKLASFKDGKWYPSIVFTGDALMEDFREVSDMAEVDRILAEAEDALHWSGSEG